MEVKKKLGTFVVFLCHIKRFKGIFFPLLCFSGQVVITIYVILIMQNLSCQRVYQRPNRYARYNFEFSHPSTHPGGTGIVSQFFSPSR